VAAKVPRLLGVIRDLCGWPAVRLFLVLLVIVLWLPDVVIVGRSARPPRRRD
jgi:hypothetical protein